MNLIDFFLKHNNKFLDFDGINGGQCVDVIKAYFIGVLGLPVFKGNAIDYWTDIYGFQRIAKSWFNAPKPGDVVIWNIKVNPFGHISICNWSRNFDFGGFEQNFPIGSPCHYQEHNYKNVLGWLRPIKKPFKIAFINATMTQVEEFLAKVRLYTNSTFSCAWERFGVSISVPSGTLTTDEAMKVIDGFKTDAKAFFIFYPPNPDSAYEVASYYPARDVSFATIPQGSPTTIMVHAFLHLLRKYINSNHIKPYIEDIEKYPTSWSDMANFDNPGWEFQKQYDELQPYFNKL